MYVENYLEDNHTEEYLDDDVKTPGQFTYFETEIGTVRRVIRKDLDGNTLYTSFQFKDKDLYLLIREDLVYISNKEMRLHFTPKDFPNVNPYVKNQEQETE